VVSRREAPVNTAIFLAIDFMWFTLIADTQPMVEITRCLRIDKHQFRGTFSDCATTVPAQNNFAAASQLL